MTGKVVAQYSLFEYINILFGLLQFSNDYEKECFTKYNNLAKNMDDLRQILADQGLKCIIKSDDTIIISYITYIQLWTTYGVDARGSVFQLIDGMWQIIQYKLPRHPEVLIGHHVVGGILDTENVKNNNTDMFDMETQRVMEIVKSGKPLGGILSFKIDGMLVCITLNFRKSNKRIQLTNNSTKMLEILESGSIGYDYVLSISTQKTEIITDEQTLGYILTAFLVSICEISHVELTKIICANNYTSFELLQEYIDDIYTFINKLYIGIGKKNYESISFCFEAVCVNRTCAWGRIHSELACSYNEAMFAILSGSFMRDNYPVEIMPHYMMTTDIKQPDWWKVSNYQIYEMMTDLENVISGIITESDFFTKYPNSNNIHTFNAEGFILYVNGNGYKVKSVSYYNAHNISNNNNLTHILEHSEKYYRYFPDIRNVRLDYDIFVQKIRDIILSIFHILNNSDSVEYQHIYSNMSDNIKNTFDHKNYITQSKILLNISNGKDIIYNIISSILEINICSDNGRTFHLFLMRCNVWDNDCIKTLNTFAANNDSNLIVLYEYYTSLKKTRDTHNMRKIITPTNCNVFGCPKSRDIDLLVQVDHREDFHAKNTIINMDIIKEKLISIGYSKERTENMDCSFAIIDNGVIVETSRATAKNTANIVYNTYKNHPQICACLVTKTFKLNIIEMIRGCTKYIMDYLKYISSHVLYNEYRIERRKAYDGEWNRVDFVIKILPLIEPDMNNKNCVDCMKSIVMKIIQIILYDDDEKEEYTKGGLAVCIGNYIHASTNAALWYLMRGTEGIYDPDFLGRLFTLFTNISAKYKTAVIWNTVDIIFDNVHDITINIDEDIKYILINQFLTSPFTPSELFKQTINKICIDRRMNLLFSDSEYLNLTELPENLLKHHIDITPQRSEEWIIKYNEFYTCGKNTGIKEYNGNPEHWIDSAYHLFRGSLMEKIVEKCACLEQIFPGNKVTKISVGFLVEQVNVRDSNAIAPDLILKLDTDELIPVEIKCLAMKPNDNCDYRREVQLATGQLNKSMAILNSHRGLLLFCYIFLDHENKNIIELQYTFITK